MITTTVKNHSMKTYTIWTMIKPTLKNHFIKTYSTWTMIKLTFKNHSMKKLIILSIWFLFKYDGQYYSKGKPIYKPLNIKNIKNIKNTKKQNIYQVHRYQEIKKWILAINLVFVMAMAIVFSKQYLDMKKLEEEELSKMAQDQSHNDLLNYIKNKNENLYNIVVASEQNEYPAFIQEVYQVFSHGKLLEENDQTIFFNEKIPALLLQWYYIQQWQEIFFTLNQMNFNKILEKNNINKDTNIVNRWQKLFYQEKNIDNQINIKFNENIIQYQNILIEKKDNDILINGDEHWIKKHMHWLIDQVTQMINKIKKGD